ITIVNISGVHNMWIKWCNCPNAQAKQESHLLQMHLFPASYKNIKTLFTFKVLDDARLSNLECKTITYQYYAKLWCITSLMFPNAMPV
ncbi:hypothetical protein L208DRAFT_1011636, partial [Tricholoma matsutake]